MASPGTGFARLRARADRAILPPSLLTHLPLTALRARGPLATLLGLLGPGLRF